MGKILTKLWDKFLEWSFQRKANKIFDKNNVKYNDGDNT